MNNQVIETSVSEVLWEQVRDEVEKAWGDVFKIVGTIISHHERFGFNLIGSNINPSFEDILLSLKLMEAMLDAFPVDNEYSTARMILNAKQQINLIERVVTAVKHGNSNDYEASMQRLRCQAQI